MKYKKHFLAFIIFTGYGFSQETKVIEIIQAGTSIRNSIEYPGATILVKDDNKRVILFHDGESSHPNIVQIVEECLKLLNLDLENIN